MNAWMTGYWSANEADRHFDFRPSRWCKSSQTSSRTWMLSEKVLPLTRSLIPDRLAKSTTTLGFLLSMYSTTPSGVMTSKGSGSPDVPRRKPRSRPLSFAKIRQVAGALPWLALAQNCLRI